MIMDSCGGAHHVRRHVHAGAGPVPVVARCFGSTPSSKSGSCHVYVLFGKVVAILIEPGLHFLPLQAGPAAFLVNWLGQRHVLDMRLDQEYLRSQPVNSEEGAPMGIGIWYEMFISDPGRVPVQEHRPARLAARQRQQRHGALPEQHAAGRHAGEPAHDEPDGARRGLPKSHEWGYRLGSVYIRKVHFRDGGMIRQIEEKVVNRLRQVTSAIRQDGANQVSIITSTAERTAAVEFATPPPQAPPLKRIGGVKIEGGVFEWWRGKNCWRGGRGTHSGRRKRPAGHLPGERSGKRHAPHP